MSDILITKPQWSELSQSQQQDLEDIFWSTTSAQEFPTDIARTRFMERFVGKYTLPSEDNFLFCAFKNDAVVGYCVGTADTSSFFGKNVPLTEQLFSEHWRRFPAHLHINLNSDVRGSGTGSRLLGAVKQHLIESQVFGLYIITHQDHRNISFYERNDFSVRYRAELNEHPLLFMGCDLTTSTDS